MRASPIESPSDDYPGVISAGELYTLPELKRRLRLNESALRTARRRGLPVYRVNGRGFVFGRDWIDYVKTNGREDVQGGGHE